MKREDVIKSIKKRDFRLETYFRREAMSHMKKAEKARQSGDADLEKIHMYISEKLFDEYEAILEARMTDEDKRFCNESV